MVTIALGGVIMRHLLLSTVLFLISITTFAQVEYVEITISTNADGVQNFTTGDMDGDGDLDVVAAIRIGNAIHWYENTGNLLSWPTHIVDTQYDVAEVETVDMDADGDLDIVSAGNGSESVFWWENDGGDTWTQHVIAADLGFPFAIEVVDADGDGDQDVYVASDGINRLSFCENLGTSWSTVFIYDGFIERVNGISAADLDNDGDIDLASALEYDEEFVWWEKQDSTWLVHQLHTNLPGPTEVHCADMNGDGDPDVLGLVFGSGDLYYHENDGTGDFDSDWLGTGWIPSSVNAADLDEDGDLDVLATYSGDGDVLWYENTGTDWVLHYISPQLQNAYCPVVVDLDQDGHLDVLAASPIHNEIRYFRQAADPQFSVQLNPTTLTLPPGGGRLIFDAIFGNNTASPQNLQAWAVFIQLGTGGAPAQTRNITLEPGTTTYEDVALQVGQTQHDGGLDVFVNLGQRSPRVVVAADSFRVERSQ